jgi:hypothetical protein
MSARWPLRAVITLALVGASCLAIVHPASASPSDEGYFVDHINAIRVSRGLGTLAIDAQLTAVARAWSEHMAADGTLAHNPSLGSQVSGWRTLGENVGTGPSLSSIEAAFENSPHHFENMVDPSYNLIGVGVVQDSNGTYWVTEDFKQPKNAPAPAPAPRPAAPRPAAPRPVAHPAPKPAGAPRPAPVHAASASGPAKPTPPVPVTAATPTTVVPPVTVPLAVLGSSTERTPAGSGVSVPGPFNQTNLAGLVALVALGASMAMVARVRVVRTASPVAG